MRKRFAVAIVGIFGFGGILSNPSNSTEQSQNAQWVSTFRWQVPAGWFGGFSGLEISSDGANIITISDRGRFVQARLQREDGAIIGVTEVQANQILNKFGEFATRPGMRDSEGLALRTDGSLVVSFEGVHRLEKFNGPTSLPKQMSWRAAFDKMKLNGGFEALAINTQGDLYAMAEVPLGDEERVQVFVLKNARWSPAFTFRRDKKFQPVGADFGPDGRLYVLERGFNGLGFRTRVRSFAISQSKVLDEELLFHRGIGVHDNLEGLAVWRDVEGRIRLTMISDDNFRFLQRTEIVEYVLPN